MDDEQRSKLKFLGATDEEIDRYRHIEENPAFHRVVAILSHLPREVVDRTLAAAFVTYDGDQAIEQACKLANAVGKARRHFGPPG